MNLVAKEFVATRVKGDGVLILSEMAGASKELYESILVNPFDLDQMADALLTAIQMPEEEQKKKPENAKKTPTLFGGALGQRVYESAQYQTKHHRGVFGYQNQ